jgi:tetrahydromethanopterin S-methyltransferase subunit G
MPNQIQIYTDEKGNKTSVIVPYEDWAKINARLESLQEKLKIFSSVRDAVQEVKEARKKGKKLQDLSDFINESRS